MTKTFLIVCKLCNQHFVIDERIEDRVKRHVERHTANAPHCSKNRIVGHTTWDLMVIG